jgi:predicted outer membrane repeat protein
MTGPTDTIVNCPFVNNTANNGPGGFGGAILAGAGTLSVSGSQLTANQASAAGGAIEQAANLSVTGCTFSNNRAATGNGGAIDSNNTTTVLLSTFVGNSAGYDGGAISGIAGILSLFGDTINGNSAKVLGGGLEQFNTGTADIGDTILFGNSPQDAFGNIVDKGGNLIGSNPMLGPLENNGGVFAGAFNDGQIVQTEALLPGSPAIGTGVNGLTGLHADERGFPSPAAGRTNISSGAFEPQYAATATANQVFVESIYETLVNQPAPANTAASLVNKLNHGGSPMSVVQMIESSLPYKNVEVQTIFERYLGRLPSGQELQSSLTMLLKGATLEQVAAGIIGGSEFFNQHGGSNETFLDGLFEDALNRLPSSTEVASFEQQLAGKGTRSQVALEVLMTREYLTDMVVANVQSLLGRAPTSTEIAFYVKELANGGRDQLVLSQILGSKEAFAARS